MEDMNEHESQQPSDEELIGRFLKNDTAAFTILYERYRRQIYAHINRLLPGQPDKADDIFQQSWIKALGTLSTYQHNDRFLPWLLKIAHNQAIDLFRRSKDDYQEIPLDDSADVVDSQGSDPRHELDRKELAVLLDAALAILPPEQREVFLLRQDDVSFREIAEIQNCSINTVLGRMQYALRNLQGFLKAKRERIAIYEKGK